MRERAFAFLSCSGCRFFAPKRPPAVAGSSASPLFVGLCTSGGQPSWTVWPGLERAVAKEGGCGEREPRRASTPLCQLFDATVESASLSYPQSCIHHGSAACPLASS